MQQNTCLGISVLSAEGELRMHEWFAVGGGLGLYLVPLLTGFHHLCPPLAVLVFGVLFLIARVSFGTFKGEFYSCFETNATA